MVERGRRTRRPLQVWSEDRTTTEPNGFVLFLVTFLNLALIYSFNITGVLTRGQYIVYGDW